MNIFTDLKSIRTGAKKAKRDIARIEAHETEHDRLHELDEGWSCQAFQDAFWDNIGDDVEHDTAEAVGYKRVSDKYRDTEARKAQKHTGNAIRFIPIELTGTENGEEIHAKIERAFATELAFEEQVSETTGKSGKTNKKGGK